MKNIFNEEIPNPKEPATIPSELSEELKNLRKWVEAQEWWKKKKPSGERRTED